MDNAPDLRHAVDVGCGTGQLTQRLASGFDTVTGIDPSADQIAHAVAHSRIDYRIAPAEQLPHDLQPASVITVAQAAHWFDLPAFYREVTRIAAPGALLALISYGVLVPDEALRARFMHFYTEDIGRYWPPERRLVDDGYATIAFPFNDMPTPEIAIALEWDLNALMGYLSTWSAVKHANAAGQSHLLIQFYDDICRIWGDPQCPRPFTWPITIRAAKL